MAAIYSMDWLAQWLWPDGKFLGITWHFMKVVGWLGNIAFSSRFFVQWWVTEKQKKVVVPQAFWWLSMFGSSCLLAYGVYLRDSVVIFAYVFTWVPYIRNLVIHRRNKKLRRSCPNCSTISPPHSNYCYACGAKLSLNTTASA